VLGAFGDGVIGNTAGFGPVIQGSSPCPRTIRYNLWMIALVILNFCFLALLLRKVKQLEKDVEQLEKSVSLFMKSLKSAYLKKRLKG
jgi:hypothetical protein